MGQEMAGDHQPNDHDRQTGGVRIGDVFGGIHDSIIAGGDVIQNIFLGGTREARDRHYQLILLSRVRDFWIKGFLARSVHNAVLIELGKEEMPGAIDHPWDIVLQLPDQPGKPLPHGKPVVDLFDEMGRALLILGQPGSGKTITLLELARDAIQRAEADPAQPIPVVFHLSSWAERRQPLVEWLLHELNDKYKIAGRISRPWLEQDRLLLLLDGLDEVDAGCREACVQAINDYRQEYGMGCIAVCSRTAEYQALTTKLQLEGAILLLPLTGEQVDGYLATAGPGLDSLRTAIHQDAALREMAQTPLMLSVMALAYRDMPAESLASPQPRTLEASRQHLFATYVAQMFERREPAQAYTPQQTETWLSWLAQKMIRHSQSLFLLEGLQPSWLSSRAQLWLYVLASRIVSAILLGLAWELFLFAPLQPSLPDTSWLILQLSLANDAFRHLGLGQVLLVFLPGWLAAGFVVGVMDAWRFTRSDRDALAGRWGAPGFWRTLGNVLLVGLTAVLGFAAVLTFVKFAAPEGSLWADYGPLSRGFVSPVAVVLSFGLFWGLRRRWTTVRSDVRTVESLTWSWRGFLGPLLAVGILPFLLTLAIAALTYEPGQTDFRPQSVLWLVLGLFVGVVGGLRATVRETKVVPNQGIWLSARYALVISFTAGLILTPPLGQRIVFIVLNEVASGPAPAFYPALSLLAGPLLRLFGMIAILAALWYGGLDVIQHFLLRFLLAAGGHIPWRYVRFLEHARERILLRKVGGGFIFIHRLLLDYFASMLL
jgi:hypothetical protein